MILAWIRSKNITAHSIAAIGVIVATLITSDQTVRNFVLELFEKHPAIGTDIVVFAGIIIKYSNSSSAAGTVAVAKVILDSPNPPTKAAVEAADTTLK
jgi:hypothetical protein